MPVPPSPARHDGPPAANPPLVCLTGIDGCGKSTHIRGLSEWLANTHGRRAAHLHVWEIAHNPRYHHHPFIADPAAVHRYLALLSGGPRALFIFHGLLESLHLVRQARPDLILANGYWYKYAFTEALTGTDPQWLRTFAAVFPRPVVTVLLDLDPALAWSRKSTVTPYECGFQPPSEATFVAFQSRLRASLRDEAAREGWPVVAVDRPPAAVGADLIRILETEVLPRWT
ncbi:MAG: Thymidylate kinase [Candidatus Ozemobacter sibiricus]|uniref:Thymidylate kinase n=1 Tax=Candidatus Ozemobacter sibiricus TaxID=2268124 RepID=A0A367ZML1_9BACT|nr:MAG: Thymidylate kinase [Candidatus Ozemobacter sibiricus]